MALILPPVFFLLLLVWVRRWQRTPEDGNPAGEGSILVAAALTGTFQVASVELLSLASAIRSTTMLLVWLVADLVLATSLVVSLGPNWRSRLRWNRPRLATAEWGILALLGCLLGTLLAVAWAVPANTPDSLLYHMARVAHWAQNRSLAHYGTAYGHQLWNPPFAESVILTLRTLWADDRPANLVQWTSLVGVLIGVSGLARLLGLGRPGRLLAVAFAVSLPMGILQATGTQNDLVTAFWLVTASYFVLLSRKQPLGRLELFSLGAALGLGLLTKGTFYVTGLVVGSWFVATRPWRTRPRQAAGEVASIAIVVVLVNLGHWSRNLAVADTPLGPSEWVGGLGTTTLAALKPKVALLLPRLLRGVAPHFASPLPGANESIQAWVTSVYAFFGVDFDATVVTWAWNAEDFAGSPLHLLLIGLTCAALILLPHTRTSGIVECAAILLAAAGLTALLVPPAITIVGVRLQLPLFVLWAPVFAGVAAALLPRAPQLAAAAALILLAFPWALFNNTRPAIGLRPTPEPLALPCPRPWMCTASPSVFAGEPVDLAFVTQVRLKKGLVGASRALEETGCTSVGLRIDSSDPEYLIWWLLDAPQSGYRLETIYTTSELEYLLDREFKPCAVVCTICGERTRLHGLDLAFQEGEVSLFVGDGFTWDEDG
jgi:hypothetical protein